MVTYARDAYLEEAWKIVTDDLVYLPIRHGVSVFAMRKNLDIPPDPWDVPRFRLARFKEEASPPSSRLARHLARGRGPPEECRTAAAETKKRSPPGRRRPAGLATAVRVRAAWRPRPACRAADP